MLVSEHVTPLLTPSIIKRNSEVVNFLILLLVQGTGIVFSFLPTTMIITVAFFYCKVATVCNATANWSLQIKLLSFWAIQHLIVNSMSNI